MGDNKPHKKVPEMQFEKIKIYLCNEDLKVWAFSCFIVWANKKKWKKKSW